MALTKNEKKALVSLGEWNRACADVLEAMREAFCQEVRASDRMQPIARNEKGLPCGTDIVKDAYQ